MKDPISGTPEKPPLHPAMFSKFVGIDEKSFNLNDYAEELQQFEELLEEYGKDPSVKPKTDKDYFVEMEPALSCALSCKPPITSDTVRFLFDVTQNIR